MGKKTEQPELTVVDEESTEHEEDDIPPRMRSFLGIMALAHETRSLVMDLIVTRQVLGTGTHMYTVQTTTGVVLGVIDADDDSLAYDALQEAFYDLDVAEGVMDMEGDTDG